MKKFATQAAVELHRVGISDFRNLEPPQEVSPPDPAQNVTAAKVALDAAELRVSEFIREHYQFNAAIGSFILLCAGYEHQERLERQFAELRRAREVAA